MRVNYVYALILLLPPNFCIATDEEQPDEEFLEFLASYETVDGEDFDPIEFASMLETETAEVIDE